MADPVRDAVKSILDGAPLTQDNVRLMIALAVEDAIKAHFQQRSEQVWLWVQRLGWIVAIIVGLSTWLPRTPPP